MSGNQTIIEPPEEAAQSRATERKTQAFTFDKSYWSACDRNEPGYCSQQTLYDDVGKELLDHAFNGFNACIFACEHSVRCGCCSRALKLLLCRRTDWYVCEISVLVLNVLNECRLWQVL